MAHPCFTKGLRLGLSHRYQRSFNHKMLTKLAVTSMAKWYDIPSVVIRSVQLNMCPICCKLVTINFMAQIGILPSCSFPVFQPIATSTTFFQIMNSINSHSILI